MREVLRLLDTLCLGSSVWVVSFSGDTVVLDVGEGSVHHTTVASTVGGGAVDELLFGQVEGGGGLSCNDES